jgi:hypothetical protein
LLCEAFVKCYIDASRQRHKKAFRSSVRYERAYVQSYECEDELYQSLCSEPLKTVGILVSPFVLLYNIYIYIYIKILVMKPKYVVY